MNQIDAIICDLKYKIDKLQKMRQISHSYSDYIIVHDPYSRIYEYRLCSDKIKPDGYVWYEDRCYLYETVGAHRVFNKTPLFRRDMEWMKSEVNNLDNYVKSWKDKMAKLDNELVRKLL